MIIGIFVVQFKNDSIISEKIGNLHISLLESISDTGATSLKNKMSVSFNGLNFSSNDDNPAQALINKQQTPLTLVSWKKISPLSCKFDFTNDITLTFNLSDDTSKAHLGIDVKIPANVTTVYIPYGLSSGASILQQTDTKLQIGSKTNAWELAANDIGENTIAFTRHDNKATYSYYDFTQSFSFEQIAGLQAASDTAFLNSSLSMKKNLIKAFEEVTNEALISEQEAVSYVAAMAENGKYTDAVDKVPSAFKKGTSRTFLSAPYFNTLEKMNTNLQSQLVRFNDQITYCANNNTFDAFTTNFIADYMCMHPGAKSVLKLLQNTAKADVSRINLSQTAGILYVYWQLTEKNKTLADMLKPVTEACYKKIESLCALDDSIITISENGTFLSVIDGIKTGNALLCYGKAEGNETAKSAGKLIINSYLKNSSSFDLKTLAELYPVIVQNNKYYPHFDILTFADGKAVWAFTCANNIGYENNNQGTISLTIDFPISNTHYLIVSGIPQFDSIYIYDMKFRTDARFETYNSSGYIYKKDNGTLLLKSRHKSEIETIRLELKKPESETTETTAQTAATVSAPASDTSQTAAATPSAISAQPSAAHATTSAATTPAAPAAATQTTAAEPTVPSDKPEAAATSGKSSGKSSR